MTTYACCMHRIARAYLRYLTSQGQSSLASFAVWQAMLSQADRSR